MSMVFYVGEHSRTFEVQWHSHDYWELVYCTSGEGTFVFENGISMHYQDGEAVAIPPKERHANNSPAGFTNIHIQLTNPPFPYRTAFRVADNSENHLKSAFLRTQFYYQADMENAELVLDALGGLVAGYMVAFRDNIKVSEPVERIKNAIIQNYGDPNFALDETIRSMPFHYDYLRKLFKKEIGVTPREYMTRLRMRKARSMLGVMQNMDYSVAEVAALCGYDNALYFSTVFKKHFGAAPSSFAGRKMSKCRCGI